MFCAGGQACDPDAEGKTLEHLVEAEGDHKRLDGAGVLRRAEGDADDHRVHHNPKLKNLRNQKKKTKTHDKCMPFYL